MHNITLKPLFAMLATSAVAGTILTILAPFGTGNLSLIERSVFWIGLTIMGGLGAASFEWLLQKTGKNYDIWRTAFAQSIGATLFVTVFMFILQPTDSLRSLALTLFYVWIIAMIICAFGALMRKSEPNRSDSTRPAIFDRLKPKLRQSEIYALASEDHYVRIYTSLGEDLILMRLADAIKESEPLTGIQTHRSWWVAENGIEAAKKSDGKITLALKSGQMAPVSRNNAKAVRAAGWA